jgi:hypothetical protein
VLKQVSPYTYELNFPVRMHINIIQQVSLLDPVWEDPLVRQQVLPPHAVEVKGDQKYHVESVEDSRMYHSQL